MKALVYLACTGLLFSSNVGTAQDFPYGSVTLEELNMKVYERDSTADAVVLKEFGEAYIDDDDGYPLIFKYHVRIKVLTKEGFSRANFQINKRKDGPSMHEQILSIKASSFNLREGSIVESLIEKKDMFTFDGDKYWDVTRLAVPDVQVGSVIELAYTFKSPFKYKFRKWEFQSDIPKIESEYWAKIPAIYRYNISIRGFLKLDKSENRLESRCLGNRDMGSPGFFADCVVRMFRMKDIPAFVEEEYMTARKNFLSAIHFELAEIRHPSGIIDKVTKEWKDAENELRNDPLFGIQLRRRKELENEVKSLRADTLDELTKAKRIYEFVKSRILWNQTYGIFSKLGIKKAMDDGKGSVADINLALVAAMRSVGLKADPVILSTRSNGVVVDLYPVISEFNYVIAKLEIEGKTYLADATEPLYPFGMLPERCFNGKGRVIGEKESYWTELVPSSERKSTTIISLTLNDSGAIYGTISTRFFGYEAARIRHAINSHTSEQDYIDDFRKTLPNIAIRDFELKNVANPEMPLDQHLHVKMDGFNPVNSAPLLNPFFLERFTHNPFKSRERLYPVDYGIPIDRSIVFELIYPPGLDLVSMPAESEFNLPNGGGRFKCEVHKGDNKVMITELISIRKLLFPSGEYPQLREMFNTILQHQNGELVFKKKV